MAAAVRCFVGLPLPQAYQDALRDIQSRIRPRARSSMSWTRPGNWHLTLKFLGEVEEPGLIGLKQALCSVRFGRFFFQARGAGFFPDPRRPRVFWVGVGPGAAECGRLAGDVDRALAPLGFRPEARAFSAHLTLARIKTPAADDWPALAEMAAARDWPGFEAAEFALWKSLLGPQGPTYVRLAGFAADQPQEGPGG
ncbi:MAG: RNA 2',3'-cyclic phosphodiesterase [Desulfovibrionaceae bacterium]|nr:RNA 2',3'-cyclic phosphodiesterase [Desulfovibrionaceae bacterium]